eukprot:COSAG02_NODE_1885_length_10515_cov_7.148522_11_plen_249_part_00
MQPRKLSSVPARRRGQKTVAGRCRPIPVAFSEENKPRRSSAVAQLLRSLCRSPPAIERRESPSEGRAQGLIVVFVVVCRARSAKVPVGALISPSRPAPREGRPLGPAGVPRDSDSQSVPPDQGEDGQAAAAGSRAAEIHDPARRKGKCWMGRALRRGVPLEQALRPVHEVSLPRNVRFHGGGRRIPAPQLRHDDTGLQEDEGQPAVLGKSALQRGNLQDDLAASSAGTVGGRLLRQSIRRHRQRPWAH